MKEWWGKEDTAMRQLCFVLFVLSGCLAQEGQAADPQSLPVTHRAVAMPAAGAVGPADCSDVVSEVALHGLPRDPTIVLRAHPRFAEPLDLFAYPFSGPPEDPVSRIRPIVWQVSEAALTAAPVGGDRAFWVQLSAQEDIFDRSEEPSGIVRACVANACPPGCACQPQVCSPPVPVVAVPAVDGVWYLSFDGEEVGTFPLQQSGRCISGFPNIRCLDLRGDTVSAHEGFDTWRGTLAADRRHMAGEISNESGEVVIHWHAFMDDN